MFQKIYDAIGFVFLAIVLALSARPSVAPVEAAPVIAEIVPLTEAEFAELQERLRKEIEARKQLENKLAALQATTVAPVVSPAHVAVSVVAAPAGAGCANGQCAVPRARVQYVRQPAEWKQEPPRLERRRGGRDGRILTPFK